MFSPLFIIPVLSDEENDLSFTEKSILMNAGINKICLNAITYLKSKVTMCYYKYLFYGYSPPAE